MYKKAYEILLYMSCVTKEFLKLTSWSWLAHFEKKIIHVMPMNLSISQLDVKTGAGEKLFPFHFNKRSMAFKTPTHWQFSYTDKSISQQKYEC